MTDKDNSVRTNVLVVKPITSTSSLELETAETYDSLENMTKHQIVELALEAFGVELDERLKKAELIDQYLKIQSKE